MGRKYLLRLGFRGSLGTGLRVAGAVAFCGLLAPAPAGADEVRFRRGDTNIDGEFDLSDGITTLLALFTSNAEPLRCEDAADADDNGDIELTDAVYTFAALYTGGPAPPHPFDSCGVDSLTPGDPLGCEEFSECDTPPVGSSLAEAGHVLNRIAYGPTPSELERVQQIGARAYVEEQLAPLAIPEAPDLAPREDSLFEEYQPAATTELVPSGGVWWYFKGITPPGSGWTSMEFDASTWSLGAAGFGYGDGDDHTVFPDMRQRADNPETLDVDESQPGFLTVYARVPFYVDDPAAIDELVLRINYDDGFIAHLNGWEVARRNVNGTPSTSNGWLYDQTAAGSHEAESPTEIVISKSRLQTGLNVLAIQGHNRDLTSSDFTLDPALLSRTALPLDPVRQITDLESLQRLVHVRGIYSTRQLQAVLAEFWENHFTTDYDKVEEYLDSLSNSDATDALSEAQAQAEAANLEHREYEFFYQNALGNFGDLLLYSAASPSMLIYLDGVLNSKVDANENYAREILELFAFGVDNRYVQKDIEELARCFTGWTICKTVPGEIPPQEDVAAFMAHLENPPTQCGVEFADDVVMDLGPGWKYFKGTEEPTPGVDSEPTTAWTEVGYDDSDPARWLDGATGIGYGDGDDTTNLSDMRGAYLSVYLRTTFTLADLGISDPYDDVENLILRVRYDDGYVAYLNGVECARSASMEDASHPPPYDEGDVELHEATDGEDFVNLNGYRALLDPVGPNVLAIQVHNANLGSSDLTMMPRLVNRSVLPGSIENGDPNGVWTFRFDADEHDTGQKVLFESTPWEIVVPARPAHEGLQDALQVIHAMVLHPSTSEFIGIKLIQRFVSDEITLNRYRTDPDSVPPELHELLADVVAVWNSSGADIGEVMQVLLGTHPTFASSPSADVFWSELAYRTKVPTPIEFINRSIRALEAEASGKDLPDRNDDMGMHLFDRDDPDGWSELGLDWVDTGRMLERMKFAQRLAENEDGDYGWNTVSFLDARGLDTAGEIVDYFDELLFQNTLPSANRDLLVEYLSTDAAGNPLPFSRTRADFAPRVEELVGVMLSMPQWSFQ